MNINKDIFNYSDYRQFLKDYYLARKAAFPKFSYKLFAEAAGFSSASFQKLVIDGKKNLTKESVLKVARALKLNKIAAEYFESLVFFNQAKTLEDKTHFLEKIDRFRKKSSPDKLLPREYDYLKEWYHCVIREMVEFPDFQESVEYIRNKLMFPTGPGAIEKSLAFLIETGFLVRDEGGKLRKKSVSLATGKIHEQEAVATIARKAHCAMIDLARTAVATGSARERNVSNTTLSLSAGSYAAAVNRIEQLRFELLELAGSDQKADQVFQLNINLFPMTKKD